GRDLPRGGGKLRRRQPVAGDKEGLDAAHGATAELVAGALAGSPGGGHGRGDVGPDLGRVEPGAPIPSCPWPASPTAPPARAYALLLASGPAGARKPEAGAPMAVLSSRSPMASAAPTRPASVISSSGGYSAGSSLTALVGAPWP